MLLGFKIYNMVALKAERKNTTDIKEFTAVSLKKDKKIKKKGSLTSPIRSTISEIGTKE